jgi:hypothetical protein
MTDRDAPATKRDVRELREALRHELEPWHVKLLATGVITIYTGTISGTVGLFEDMGALREARLTLRDVSGAGRGNRTPTGLRPPDFESGASA